MYSSSDAGHGAPAPSVSSSSDRRGSVPPSSKVKLVSSHFVEVVPSSRFSGASDSRYTPRGFSIASTATGAPAPSYSSSRESAMPSTRFGFDASVKSILRRGAERTSAPSSGNMVSRVGVSFAAEDGFLSAEKR